MSGCEGATTQLDNLSLSDASPPPRVVANVQPGSSHNSQNNVNSDLNLKRQATAYCTGSTGLAVACGVEARIIEFVDYQDESQLPAVMSLVGMDLSEPYSSTLHPLFNSYISSTPVDQRWY
jgi:hypothetical protein